MYPGQTATVTVIRPRVKIWQKMQTLTIKLNKIQIIKKKNNGNTVEGTNEN